MLTKVSTLTPVWLTALAASLLVGGCGQMPSAGPSTKVIVESTQTSPASGLVQLVDIDENVAARLAERQRLFSDTLGELQPLSPVIGPGDMVEVTIWEAPPATLFSSSNVDPHFSNAGAGITVPGQMVDREGYIVIPFAGRVMAAGLSTATLGNDISAKLKGKANQPQAMVRIAQNASSTVAVVGEVTTNLRMPLTASGERLLDAIAAAGGVRQPVGKTVVQVTRGSAQYAMALDKIIRDPRQNVALRPGDVITAVFQPLAFTALGAAGKQSEVPFEASGISLAQALGRIGGVLDNRADPQGVFLFRFEPRSALNWPSEPVATTASGLVPVIYRLNLKDPRSFFAMQNFAMRDQDLVYVSNAPLAELQKFITLVFSINRQVLATVDNLP